MLADLRVFTAALAAVFGLVFGSFLNVCIYRVPRDLSVVFPRSFCPECGAPIAWWDNLPILSYLFLRGRCRSCTQLIGFRYPLVELLTAVAFGFVAWQYGFTLVALKWFVFEAIMIVLFWTDLEERLLPDEFTLGGTVIAVLFGFVVAVPGLPGDLFFPDWTPRCQTLANLTVGAVLLSVPVWILGSLYSRFRRVDALGFGDVKLLLLLGAFFGVSEGFLAFLTATVAAAILGLAHALIKGKDPRTHELPLGTFLSAAGAVLPLIHHLGETL